MNKIVYPAGGMSEEDAGDGAIQKTSLEASPGEYPGGNPDGTLPNIPGVADFGGGPDVRNMAMGGEKTDCCPGKPGCEPSGGATEKY